MRRLFIANRGEIARRIATSASRLGIEPVVPPVDGPGAVDLLDATGIARAALAAGADGVHPGYGFLAESPDLARAVLEAGLAWVGPPPAVIAALGDKAAARTTAARVGVPIPEGETPGDQSDDGIAVCAGRIGYPVLVKPVAGGGGKGIRTATSEQQLRAVLAGARREAIRAFGDGRLLVERAITDARHVEVQILGDQHGSLVHLGDRDCSLQRRHQKLVEEAPAPDLAGPLRSALWDAALTVAREVGYRNAGTCEFLVDGAGAFVFLEMNARLQVEHPVTELVLGRDLVADQLAIVDGVRLADLGLDQAAIEAQFHGGGRHAIEVRLNAEDPSHDFVPSTGRVVAVRWPPGTAAFGPTGESGIRVDAGVDPGDHVGGRFDPLLAKVIATAPNRTTALDRLAGALEATEVLGLATNLAFLRRVVALPVLREARARIDTVEHDPEVIAVASLAPEPPDAAWRVAARLLASDAGPAWPWGAGWRVNQPARLQLVATWGATSTSRVVALAGDEAAPFAVLDDATAWVSVAGAGVAFAVGSPPDLDAGAARASRWSDAGAEALAELRAPMPGTVIAVHAATGDRIVAGDPVLTIEAMKMEHVVTAPAGGRLEALLVGAGEQVERGRVVARVVPDDGGAG